MSVAFFAGMFVLGWCVGLMNAALGIGGGILMVPALREAVPGIDAHTAKGTSLFIIIFVAALNAWRQNRGRDDVPWRLAAVLASGSILGGYAGAWFTGRLSGGAVTWIFIALVLVVAARLLFSEARALLDGGGRHGDALAFGIGLATGATSGMTGIGGGLVLVSLVLLAGLACNERVTALSNLVMVGTCTASTYVHLTAARSLELPGTVGQVCLAVAPAIFLGAQLGSPLGQWVNARLSYPKRKIALVALLVVVAARMTYRAVT